MLDFSTKTIADVAQAETLTLPKERRIRKKSIRKQIAIHLRRIGVIALNTAFGWDMFFWFIGVINLFTKKFGSVFFMYPANEKYTKEYVYLWYANLKKWNPFLAGVTYQNGKFGLKFAFSATEKDFLDRQNTENLKKLEARSELIRKLLRVPQKTFSGTLPNILHSRNILQEPMERMVTVNAVMLALDKLRQVERLVDNVPVIVLGGQGFIGSELMRKTASPNFFSVDVSNTEEFYELMQRFRPHGVIVLNLTKKGAISNYLNSFWSGVVVLNEVYPEPSKEEVKKIKATGAVVYHIVGAKGWAVPAFPRGYEGAIPCCASVWGSDYEIVIKKL